MRQVVFVGLAVVAVASRSVAQDPGQMPRPGKEHAWLEQLAGEWESHAEALAGPNNWVKTKGSEKGRMHGGFWLIAEGETDMMGMKVKSVFTLGFDTDKKKYIATWVDNCLPHMWTYEGTLDPSGKVLTLETEGPNLLTPGKTAKFREVITLVSPDEKTFTSSMQGDDGQWITFVRATYKRKK
jgi:hypothetical protein